MVVGTQDMQASRRTDARRLVAAPLGGVRGGLLLARQRQSWARCLDLPSLCGCRGRAGSSVEDQSLLLGLLMVWSVVCNPARSHQGCVQLLTQVLQALCSGKHGLQAAVMCVMALVRLAHEVCAPWVGAWYGIVRS